ncbi:MAG: DUF6457 domain-containing protein [Actinomycetota bacterium]
MEANETKWLGEVEARLGDGDGPAVDDRVMRLLLRITKVTADATGVRYLAPLTAYLVGLAAGRAEVRGDPIDLRAVADQVDRLAKDWQAQPGG